MAEDYKAKVNLYYTPTVLTTNSLIFNKEKMEAWWKAGFEFAAQKSQEKDKKTTGGFPFFRCYKMERKLGKEIAIVECFVIKSIDILTVIYR